MLTITPTELHNILTNTPDTITLIDVRNTGEYDEVHIAEAINIPLHLLPMRAGEIDTTKKMICICRSGGRSSQACGFLRQQDISAYNLTGGMMNYESAFPQGVIHSEKKKGFFGLF